MHHLTGFSRREFLGSGVGMAAGGAVMVLSTACAGREDAESRPAPPSLRPVALESDTVSISFGESPEEAGVLWGRALPEGYDGSLTNEQFTFAGEFAIDDGFMLVGTADVRLSDDSVGQVEIAGGQITVRYGDDTLLFRDVGAGAVERNGQPTSLDGLYDTLRLEASSAGLSALSSGSRALVIYAAFWHTGGVVANVDAVRQYVSHEAVDDTDYDWWCEAWSMAGAIAVGALGVVGCALLLAGCAGTVVLDGLGVVSCVTANIICGMVMLGVSVLVEAIKELVWASDDVDT